MLKRPFMVIVFGYIIGILWGLYFKSIVPFYIILYIVYFIIKKRREKQNQNKKKVKGKKFKFISIKRIFRYLKLVINQKVILVTCIISIISNFIFLIQENKYQKTYIDGEKLNISALIVAKEKQTNYNYTYRIKVLDNKYKNTFLYIKINRKKANEIIIGDKVKIKGTFIESEIARNYKGFNYKEYLKIKRIYGTIKVNKIDIISKCRRGSILEIKIRINEKIENMIDKLYDTKTSSFLKGVLIGDKSNIDEDIKDNFNVLNISHILAISGMHINYIIISFSFVLDRFLGKRKSKIIIIIVLLFYVFLVGISSSIIRAVIMGLVGILSKLIHRKNDIYNSLAISLLINLIYNPYLIFDIGLQLSYIGTIGILLGFRRIKYLIEEKLNKKIEVKYKKNAIVNKILYLIIDIFVLNISVQIFTLPVMLYNYNTIGIYGILVNILFRISNWTNYNIKFNFNIIRLFFISYFKISINYFEFNNKFFIVFISNFFKITTIKNIYYYT